MRGHAAEALAYTTEWLPDKEDDRELVVTALVDALTDLAVEVRFWSAFALGTLGDKRAVPTLQHLVDSDESVLQNWWSVRKEATDALRLIHCKYRF